MSFILEALKKSERERARGTIPVLETGSGQTASHKSLWLGVLIGAGTLFLMVVIAWFIINEHSFQWPSSKTDDTVAGANAARDEPKASFRVRSTGGPTQPDGSTGDTQRRVTDLSELDPDARRRLQGLSVNVVSYSEVPERRFVMLNQRIVRESESVGDGVVVKRITPEGALLGVGDYEILIGPD